MELEILYHEYHLHPLAGINSRVESSHSRKGALLCINGGYACIQPWPELGDEPLSFQLKALQDGQSTRLLDQAFTYAAIDREARSQSISLFANLTIPKSHTTCTDLQALSETSPAQGCYKIKVGKDRHREAQLINSFSRVSDILFRLDANAAWTPREALLFWETLSPQTRSCIEFFEDPCQYTEESWQELYAAGIPLAYDHYCSEKIEKYYDVRVIKPVVQDCESIIAQELAHGRKIVFTSAMDHPLGQCIAAWEAARFMSRNPDSLLTCGLLSHTIYQANIFSKAFSVHEGRLTPPVGTGFGFDDLLRALPWTKLLR